MRRRPSRWFLSGTVTVFALASVVSLVAIWLSPLSSPIIPAESGSLTHLANVAQRSTARRYALYLELDDQTDGATLIVPDSSTVNNRLVEGLAAMTLETRSYDPTAIPEDLVPRSEPHGELEIDDSVVRYWILSGETDEPRWVARFAGGLVIVPFSAAPVPDGT